MSNDIVYKDGSRPLEQRHSDCVSSPRLVIGVFENQYVE